MSFYDEGVEDDKIIIKGLMYKFEDVESYLKKYYV